MTTTSFAESVWVSPEQVFDRLEGNWSMQRSIEGQASLEGVAKFVRQDPAVLLYEERGTLRLNSGQAFDAERSYVYMKAGAGFSVFFAETPVRLFHEVGLAWADHLIVGAASHLCRLDSYRSRYEFFPDGAFALEHRVTGPKKDYVMHTTYLRVSGDVVVDQQSPAPAVDC